MASRAVTTGSFDKEVSSADNLVLVDFWASWCGPCRALAPTLEALSDELGERLTLLKCDVDAEPDLATKFHIVSIPTLMLFRGGRHVHTMVGNMPAPELRREIERLL